jgi:hypothetical protein
MLVPVVMSHSIFKDQSSISKNTLTQVMILLLMITAWAAYMVWTEKRILAGRFDFCCCCGRGPKQTVATGVPVAQPVNGANGNSNGSGKENGGQQANGIGSHRMSGDSAHLGAVNGHGNGAPTNGAADGDVSAVAINNPHYHKENIVKLFFRKVCDGGLGEGLNLHTALVVSPATGMGRGP